MDNAVFEQNVGREYDIVGKIVNTGEKIRVSVPEDANVEIVRQCIRNSLDNDILYKEYKEYAIELKVQLPGPQEMECHLFDSSYVSLVIPPNTTLLVKYVNDKGNLVFIKQPIVTQS